jgi:OOP family OmpA-OmpF porin
MNRLIILGAGLLLLWLLFQFGARNEAPVIQADIDSRTVAAIADQGLDDVDVSADGRDVTLSGAVSADADRRLAETTAGGVYGVRVVRNETTIAVAPYITRFCKDATSIRLSGDVPVEDDRRAFPERARDMFRFWAVEDDFSIRSGSPDGFRRFMDQALIELGQLDEGCITLNDRELQINGAIRSQRAIDLMKDRMARVSEQYNFSVVYDLALPTLSDEALACQREANRRVEPGETVLFDFDSAEVHESGQQLLNEIIEIATLCPDVAIEVSGHSDAVGDKAYNIDLSERRAQAVVTYLVNSGMDEDRLTAVGLGFSQPISDNSTDEGRAMNRRIEFRAREE